MHKKRGLFYERKRGFECGIIFLWLGFFGLRFSVDGPRQSLSHSKSNASLEKIMNGTIAASVRTARK